MEEQEEAKEAERKVQQESENETENSKYDIECNKWISNKWGWCK